VNRLHSEAHREIPDDPLRTEMRKPPSFRVKEFSDEYISYVSHSVSLIVKVLARSPRIGTQAAKVARPVAGDGP
jgi:hypothetical protein